MAVSRNSVIVLLLVNCLSLTPSNAYDAVKRSYVVYMGSHAHGSNPNLQDLQLATESHHLLLASYTGSYDEAKDAIIYSYTKYINGFVAMLNEGQATEIAKDPKVVSVFLNKPAKLHTTHSWDFLFLQRNTSLVDSTELWYRSRFGEDVIIANIDTGVWPESKSFDDHGYGPIPSKWKGACAGGPKFHCNRKLIGARYFNKGFLADGGLANGSDTPTARDSEGHGSHTLSTIGGNFVDKVNVDGVGYGTAKGGAPRARVVAYKICWTTGCYDADILAAFDQAIEDGVDIISASIGGSAGRSYFDDGISIGSFHAVANGITVVASAGNDGPAVSSVTNVAPWIFTVGASTIDRRFESVVVLPNGLRIKGSSASKGLQGKAPTFYPLVTGLQAKLSNDSDIDAELCIQGLDPKKVKGKILVCRRGISSRVQKGIAAWQAGAKGMILVNDKDSGNEVLSDAHILPASHITYQDGLKLFAYINSTKNPTAYLTVPRDVLNTKPAPFIASFSSRGPNIVTPEIIKPDITAPGVDIVAAYSLAISPTEEDVDPRRFSYISMSGTSMSCPHVAGLVGSLKAIYPHWSPAALRSAVITTAQTRDNEDNLILDSDFKPSNPFGYGSGHIQPNKAVFPGLVYNTTTEDYLDFFCAIGYTDAEIKPFIGNSSHYKCSSYTSLANFNYPSISVPEIRTGELVTLKRRLTNVGPPRYYRVYVNKPAGVDISVKPSLLEFEHSGVEKSFEVTIKVERRSKGYVFGDLTWSDGEHFVRSPIAVNTGN